MRCQQHVLHGPHVRGDEPNDLRRIPHLTLVGCFGLVRDGSGPAPPVGLLRPLRLHGSMPRPLCGEGYVCWGVLGAPSAMSCPTSLSHLDLARVSFLCPRPHISSPALCPPCVRRTFLYISHRLHADPHHVLEFASTARVLTLPLLPRRRPCRAAPARLIVPALHGPSSFRPPAHPCRPVPL